MLQAVTLNPGPDGGGASQSPTVAPGPIMQAFSILAPKVTTATMDPVPRKGSGLPCNPLVTKNCPPVPPPPAPFAPTSRTRTVVQPALTPSTQAFTPQAATTQADVAASLSTKAPTTAIFPTAQTSPQSQSQPQAQPDASTSYQTMPTQQTATASDSSQTVAVTPATANSEMSPAPEIAPPPASHALWWVLGGVAAVGAGLGFWKWRSHRMPLRGWDY